MSRASSRQALALGLWFGAATALAASVGGGFLVARISRALDAQARGELERRVEDVERALDELREELDRGLDDVSLRLSRDASFEERIAAGGVAAVEIAERLVPRESDSFWIRDERGRVVSASHWPELAGLPDPLASAVLDGAILAVPTTGVSSLSLVRVRPIELGGRGHELVVGRRLGGAFLARIASGDVAELQHGSATIAHAGPVVDLGSDSSLWLAEAVPLGDDVSVVLARDTTDLASLRGGLVRAVVLFGVVATAAAAAAGAWIGRRQNRPVEQLVRTVDAIAAGSADWDFPGARQEIDEIARAFSRLRRALDREIERARAAEHVAAWKEVAQRVAHEVKNPLVPIRLTLENLRHARSSDPPVFDRMFDDAVRAMLEEVDHLSRLVTEFRELARLPPQQPRRVDLHELIDETLELYRAEPGLEIARDYATDLPVLVVDPDQMRRVWHNVVGNAVAAMRGDSREPSRLDVRSAREDGMALVEISDRGPGLPVDALAGDRALGFTTKPGGSGLGMAIAWRIVVDHGGILSATNRPGGGTCVSIRLPIAGASA